MTSAGSAAGLDLCLHMVRQDFGVAMANAVARRLVLPAHRDGMQPQILGAPATHERGGRIAPLLDLMRASPGEAWPTHRMADIAGLTRRTFARRFVEGFISVERFQSLTDPSKLLSLSFFEDEAAIVRWRNLAAHRGAQAKGRGGVFDDYRLRIATVVRDYGMFDRAQAPSDSKVVHMQ